MTPQQAKRAFQLWKRYKTSTTEYRQLAESLGMTTAQLNQRCWQINHDKRKVK